MGDKWEDNNMVLANSFGRVIDTSNFTTRYYKKMLVAAGIDRSVKFHDLRHTHATLLLLQGVNVKVVSERLGHTRNVGTWTTKASISVAKHNLGTATLNGNLYAIGGSYWNRLSNSRTFLSDVTVYNPDTNVWTLVANLPTALEGCATIAVNGKIYIFGGNTTNILKTVLEYDPVTDIWTAKADMPTARTCAEAVAINGKIYVIGGASTVALSNVEVFDPITNIWTTKVNMPTARTQFTLAVVRDKIYACGGCGGFGTNFFNAVEMYDPDTNNWIVKASMPTARAAHGAMVNDMIYVIGGTSRWTSNSAVPLNVVEQYNPITDIWTTMANMPTARFYEGVTVLNNIIYAIGGCTGGTLGDDYVKTVEAFMPPVVIPINLTATAGDSQITLYWTVASGATSYNVKRSTTAGGPYTTIVTNVPGTSYLDTTVANGTTYYYVVTAVDSDSNESANSNEASATPQAPSGHGLLRITMNDSSEREYELSLTEIDDFVTWCDRTVGTGSSLYVFDKTYNVGEFKSRKEYLLFEKIISFEVVQLTK